MIPIVKPPCRVHPMTDKELFEGLLTRAGFKWTTSEHQHGEEWAVTGCFYDELYINFNDNGDLINMSSHVAADRASCDRAKEYELWADPRRPPLS